MCCSRDQEKKEIRKEEYDNLIQKLLRGMNDLWMVQFGSKPWRTLTRVASMETME